MMTDEEYQIRRKYENRNLMQELKWVSHYPPSGMSDQDKDFIRWIAMTAHDRINELERKRGKWVGNKRHQSCSECHMTYCVPDGQDGELDMTAYHFCPNCGADMRKEEVE